MNLCVIKGNIGTIQEKNKKDGFTKFSVAVQRSYKNKKDEYDVDWFNCIVFGKTADFFDKYFEVGSPILVKGHIEFYKGGTKKDPKYYTTLVSETIEFAGKKGGN